MPTPLQRFLIKSGGETAGISPAVKGSPISGGRGGGGIQSAIRGTTPGEWGGLAGSLMGLGAGVPGLGLLGAGLGTAYNVSDLNTQLSNIGAAPNVSWGPAFGSNISFGLLGTPARKQAAWAGTPSPFASYDDPGGIGGLPKLQPGEVDLGAEMPWSDGGDGGGGGFGTPGASAEGAGTPFFEGGPVKAYMLRGPDPKGPDDGSGNLDIGEHVIKASSVKKLEKKYGPAVMSLINAGKLPNRKAKTKTH